jgi:hypothetical protein
VQRLRLLAAQGASAESAQVLPNLE